MYKRLTVDEKKFIVNNYSNIGAQTCSEHIGRSKECVSSFAKRHSLRIGEKLRREMFESNLVKARHAREIKQSDPTLHKVNSLLFENISTPEVAYILGLIWADGSIVKNFIKIQAVKRDLDTLKWIFMKIGSWYVDPLIEKGGNRQSQMLIGTNNKRLRQFLEDHDYKSKSTFSADKILAHIPEYLRHYWWRGIVDGDGCFYRNEKGHQCQFSITSSYNQDWSFAIKMMSDLGIRGYRIHKDNHLRKDGTRGHSSLIRVSGRFDVASLAEYIYQGYETDGQIGLKRKHDKWLRIKELVDMSKQCGRRRRNVSLVDVTTRPPASAIA